jgi:hypothetical protein
MVRCYAMLSILERETPEGCRAQSATRRADGGGGRWAALPKEQPRAARINALRDPDWAKVPAPEQAAWAAFVAAAARDLAAGDTDAVPPAPPPPPPALEKGRRLTRTEVEAAKAKAAALLEERARHERTHKYR